MAAETGEIPPPWVEYPGYEPGHIFWRQTGEPFFNLVWEPFYEALSETQKEDYRARWKVPEVWQDFYFDKKWRDWLESTDEDE